MLPLRYVIHWIPEKKEIMLRSPLELGVKAGVNELGVKAGRCKCPLKLGVKAGVNVKCSLLLNVLIRKILFINPELIKLLRGK